AEASALLEALAEESDGAEAAVDAWFDEHPVSEVKKTSITAQIEREREREREKVLRGGSSEHPAIISGGSLFARNVTISPRYGLGLQEHAYHWKNGLGEKTDLTLPPELIDEWSPAAASLWREPDEVETLNLLIEETPYEPLPLDFEEWVCVDDFGADGTDREDDTAAIRAALDHALAQGKSVLAFSAGGTYYGSGTFELGGSLRHVVGAGSFLRPNKGTVFGFRLVDGDHSTVTFDLIDRSLVPSISIDLDNASSRTLVVRCLRGELTATGPGRTFLEDACQRVVIRHEDARVWVRQLNSERGDPYANENHGGTLWILGLKSEKTPCLVGTFGGGKTE
ncbi:MAG: hypothetical protein AAF368_20705, partial [Planctomycetota bacterium]